ncbi:monothiol glutaredoxin grx5 [Coemansia sp. RSA 2703]|nr:monothiol glutaredoxin grx5 [Coemansia sp. RSA 2703]KAJ2377144.1 monothiol glutaredoxin grx5 [Coemansia sp. RSA 2607]KAJ2397752.1 monothiol glutaredoxin grx5 [Coemansia sp. RSA 2603]
MFRNVFRNISLPASRTAFALPSRIASVRFITDRARSIIDDAVKQNELVVFMKGTPNEPMCGFSRAVIQILQMHGVDEIAGVDCLQDPEIREGIKEYTEWPTIPQVYVKGEFIGGCDVLVQMHQSGELHELLVKEGILKAEPDDAEESKKD